MSRLPIVGVVATVLAPFAYWFIPPLAIVILIVAGFACSMVSVLSMESKARQAVTKQDKREQNRAHLLAAH